MRLRPSSIASQKPKALPLPTDALSRVLNVAVVGSPRNNDRDKFRIHVSDVLETKGPRAFCARHQVISYWSNRQNAGGKLTAGRRLLFARGQFEGDYIVDRFLRESPFAEYVYANWSCYGLRPGRNDAEHEQTITTFGKVVNRKCKCGRPMRKHNEIDLNLPSLLLTGHPDMVIYYEGKFYVYEFKSIDRQDVSFDDLVSPLAGHRLQISFYYKIMRALRMPTSRRLTVLYVDRSNAKIWGGHPYKELQVNPDSDEDMAPFKNALLHVVQGIKTKKLPDRICPTIKSERAKACPFAVECFLRRSDRVR